MRASNYAQHDNMPKDINFKKIWWFQKLINQIRM